MKTVTVCIGNSDNKLTQEEWSNYYICVSNIITETARGTEQRDWNLYFEGFTNPCSKYQSASFVIGTPEYRLAGLISKLTACRKSFRQDSIAIVVGETQFI